MDEIEKPRGRKVIRFEDLIAWQRARQLAKEIYLSTSKKPFSRDFSLKDQITRAIVSVMSNIAEGFERGGRSEFHQFLVIAKGSCAEVKSQLYVAGDIGYLSTTEAERLMGLTENLARILGKLKASVAKQRTPTK
jgi:four helix bundle protein